MTRAAQRPNPNHALAQGFSGAFLVGVGVMLLGLVITLVAIRIRPADVDGTAI